MTIRSCASATEHRARTAAGEASRPLGLSGSVTMTERIWRPSALAADTARASCSASGTPAVPGTKCASRPDSAACAA